MLEMVGLLELKIISDLFRFNRDTLFKRIDKPSPSGKAYPNKCKDKGGNRLPGCIELIGYTNVVKGPEKGNCEHEGASCRIIKNPPCTLERCATFFTRDFYFYKM